jgi:hypothetical protein
LNFCMQPYFDPTSRKKIWGNASSFSISFHLFIVPLTIQIMYIRGYPPS